MSKNFEELLKALKDTEDEATATLAKAQAPAAADGDNELEDDPDADGAGDAGDDAAIQAAAAEAGAGEFGKSFEFTDASGKKHEAVDATDLVKSLIERVESADETMAKALTAMNSVMSKQGELIKSLSTQVQALSSQGRGRKTVLNVAEKPDVGVLAKSQADEGMNPDQFFAKANAAFDAEKISGKDLNVISVCLRSNHPIDPALIQRVISA
jgi:hypothetical protein